MKTASLRILLVGLLISTCALAGPGADARGRVGKRPKQVALGQEFKLRQGQEVAIKGHDLRVKFDALVEDSRCPTGVNCVWAGDAKILVGARQAKSEAVQLELHTNGQFAQVGMYQQYTVKLVALDPHPKADVEVGQKDYVATLLITRES